MSYAAIRALVAAPDPAVELLRQRLAERSDRPDSARLEKWIAELDHDEFVVREKAMRNLAAAGSQAEPLMRHALGKHPSPEVRRRIQELLEHLVSGTVAAEDLRTLRAIEVLERIGTSAARYVLVDLAKRTADAEVAEEIKASLQRLQSQR
jgi:hypothetical protein